MKRNVFYGALLVLLLGFLVRENRLIHIPKQVEKTEESAEWQPEWYEQMAEEINDSPITLEVDGTMVDPQLGSLRMSQDGQFMIPYGMLPDALSCAVLLYDGNRIVMERGNTHAEMTVGSPELLLGEESQTIAAPPEWENGILYVPLEAVTEVFSYEENWDAENRKMELTGSEDPATFLPESYDYRKAGRAPAVKNQVECQLFGGSYVPPEQLPFFTECRGRVYDVDGVSAGVAGTGAGRRGSIRRRLFA